MMVAKRILHCIPSMGGGGTERQLTYLCQGLIRLGWDVHVTLLNLGPNAARLQTTGAKIHPVAHRSNYDPMILWRLISLIKHLRPGIVHTWIPMMDIMGGIASRLTGVPFIISERNSSLAYGDTWKDRLRRLVASQASAIIANSAAGKSYWQSQLGDGVPKYVIPNAVPLEEIDLVPPGSHQSMDIDRKHEVILYAGRLLPHKNLENLIHALNQVFAARSQAVAVLCGEGSYHDRLAGLVRRYGIQSWVTMPGYVQDLWGWMKSADVFVSISLYEGRPNTVLEAMACKCPVVVSDIPEHREILDKESALFVPADNPEAVAAGIVQTLSHHDQAMRRAGNAKTRVSEWSIDAIAQQYHSLYSEILKRHDS